MGVCRALRPDDYIASNHRGHGHLIAKGGDLRRMLAEITHKATGYCKGYGGSLHITDVSLGILGMNGIVGAAHLFAAGAAYGIKVKGTDQVAVSFGGDGSHPGQLLHQRRQRRRRLEAPLDRASSRTTATRSGSAPPTSTASPTWPGGPTATASRGASSTATTCWPSTTRPSTPWTRPAPAAAPPSSSARPTAGTTTTGRAGPGSAWTGPSASATAPTGSCATGWPRTPSAASADFLVARRCSPTERADADRDEVGQGRRGRGRLRQRPSRCPSPRTGC